MKAGKLNKRITIRSKAENDTPLGRKLVFSDVATVWAEVSPLSFFSRYAAGADRAEALVVFRIRHREDIQPHYEVLYNGKPHKIVGMSEIGNREGLEIRAEVIE